MLIRLIDRSYPVIQIRRARILDVVAKNMGDDFIAGEIHQSLDAMAELLLVTYIKPAGVQGIAGK